MSWLSEAIHRGGEIGAKAVATHEAASIVEFWLNRYQTLIAAIFAIAAALIGGWFVLRVPRIEAEYRKISDDLAKEAAANAAVIAITRCVHSAALAHGLARKFIRTSDAHKRGEYRDEIKSLCFHLGRALDHFLIRDVINELEINKRLQCMMIVGSLEVFVQTFERPITQRSMNARMAAAVDTLNKSLVYIRAFDEELAAVFERDSAEIFESTYLPSEQERE